MKVICKCGIDTIVFTKLKKMWRYERIQNGMPVWEQRMKAETAEAMIKNMERDGAQIVRR